MRVRRTFVRCTVVATVLCIAGGSAFAITKLPKPGTAAQIKSRVASAPSIQKLPSNLVPPLSEASQDSTGEYYGVAGRRCEGVTKCVFADTKSKTTIVLFGDSHAQMWLPALVPVALRARDRLVLVWRSGCPAAAVGVWNANTHSVDQSCNTFRSKMISSIHKLAPAVVLLADRTSDIPGADNKLITDAAWKSGEESTIAALKGAKTKVAVIGDITAFLSEPPQCLAGNPNSVQMCSVPNPNPKTHQHFAAERSAASAESVPYIDPQPWLCTTTCSTVVGNMVGYYDKFHVTATYAEYLSNVWWTALKSLLGA